MPGRGRGGKQSDASPPGPRSSDPPEPNPRRLRVLLAEDDPMNQKVVACLLEKIGYEIDVVDNGHEAVEAVKRKRYDLVLMDIKMPVLDGLQATRKIIEQVPKSERPLIVALTAHVMVHQRETCLASGMDDFLAKPLRLQDLHAALNRWARMIHRPISPPP